MLPLLLGAIGSLVGGAGNLISNLSANDRASAIQDQALQNYLSINVPDPAQQQVILQKFVQTGKLDPALQKAFQQSPTALSKIQQNPTYQAAQDRALASLENIGHGGLTLGDRANLQDIQLQNASQARGQQDRIIQGAAERGTPGSLASIAAQLESQQGSAQQNAQQSLRIAGDAQTRALQAIEGAGSLANNMGNQQWNQQASVASAEDAINRFNTQALQNASNANTSAQNYAQEYNLTNQQNIANMNTQAANQNAYFNSGLQQQQFQNQLAKANGMQGIYNNQSGLAQKNGQDVGNFFTNAANAGLQYGGAMQQQQDAQANRDFQTQQNQANRDFWSQYFPSQTPKNETSYDPNNPTRYKLGQQ